MFGENEKSLGGKIMGDNDIKTTKNNDGKKKKIIIISSAIAVLLIISAVLFVKLYKIPYDNAKADFNIAMEQFNVEMNALQARNDELDNNIELLNQVINAKDIPVDELLLADAQTVLIEARAVQKDAAPEAPTLSSKIDEVKEATIAVKALTNKVSAMGDYSETLTKLQATELEYRTMIESFEGVETKVEWIGVDKENTVLRFVVKLSNPNDYTLKGVNIEWVAYDVYGAVVGSFSGSQPDIPANGYVYYVGGAGSANLSGTPATVDVNATSVGILTNRVSPQFTVSDVQLKDNGFSWYTVSAVCQTDSDINTAYLDGQFIVKDSEGNVIDADFWNAENLPDNIKADGKFNVSEDYFDLPTFPKSAEVYMYYKWE